MKDIFKNRFLTWLMWIIPISFLGLPWALIWTVIQIFLYKSEIDRQKKKKVPLWEDPEIIKLNPNINLTEDYEGLVNIGNGISIYQRNRKAWIKKD